MLSFRSCGANWNRLTLPNRCAMAWNGKIPLLAQLSTSMASTDNILMVRTPTVPKQQLRSICYSGARRNSSSNPKTPTINLDDLQEIVEEEQPESNPKLAESDLAERECRYGEPPKWLTIKFQRGKRGHKMLRFTSNGIGLKFYNFPNVHVPEDVVGFVRAMDELLGAVEVNRDRIEALANRTQQQPNVVLHTAKANGFLQDFQLDLRLGYNLFVQLRTVPNNRNPEHRPGRMNLPVRQFHWLRLRIGEMLAENGEQQLAEQLGKAPRLPAWIGQDNFRQSPPNNVRTQQQPPPQTQQQPTQSQSPAVLQQLLLQLVLQQQQQLHQMQTPNGWQQNNGGFGAFPAAPGVPQVPVDPTSVLLSNLLAQVQQQPVQTAQQQPMNTEQQLLAMLLQQLQTNQNNS